MPVQISCGQASRGAAAGGRPASLKNSAVEAQPPASATSAARRTSLAPVADGFARGIVGGAHDQARIGDRHAIAGVLGKGYIRGAAVEGVGEGQPVVIAADRRPDVEAFLLGEGVDRAW